MKSLLRNKILIFLMLVFAIKAVADTNEDLNNEARENGFAVSNVQQNEDGTYTASGVVYIPGAGVVPVEFKSYINLEDEVDHLQREVERHAQRYYRRAIHEVSSEIENGAEDVVFNGLRAFLVKEIESLNTVWQREMRRHDIFEIESIESMPQYAQEQQCKERLPYIFRDGLRNMSPRIRQKLDQYCEVVTKDPNLIRTNRVFEAVHCLQFYENTTNSFVRMSVGQIIDRCVSVFDLQFYEDPTRIIWFQQ